MKQNEILYEYNKGYQTSSKAYPAHLTLSAEQVSDLEERLESFQKHGILTADKAYTVFKKVITSSDSTLNPEVCLNVINLKHTNKDYKQNLINHSSNGILNMSIERHSYIECEDLAEFRWHLKQRLNCTFVLIVDLNKIPDDSVASFASHYPGVTQCKVEESIPKDAILGIMVPDGLKKFASKFFDCKKVISVPIHKGNLTLSSFTLGTALNYKNLDKSGIVEDMPVPDYEAALIEFIKQHPDLPHCGLHLSRFATEHDLMNVFKKRTQKGMTDHFKSLMYSHLDSFFSKPDLKDCDFSPQTPTQRFCIETPCYSYKDFQKSRAAFFVDEFIKDYKKNPIIAPSCILKAS